MKLFPNPKTLIFSKEKMNSQKISKVTSSFDEHFNNLLYQMGSNEFWQNPEEIANQLKFNCQFDHISGTIFFTYRDLVKGQNDVKDKALDTIKELWCK